MFLQRFRHLKVHPKKLELRQCLIVPQAKDLSVTIPGPDRFFALLFQEWFRLCQGPCLNFVNFYEKRAHSDLCGRHE